MNCPNCGKNSSSSPTGDWCNFCGWQDPCPCWIQEYCPSHDPLHKHSFDNNGYCVTINCPAKRKIGDVE